MNIFLSKMCSNIRPCPGSHSASQQVNFSIIVIFFSGESDILCFTRKDGPEKMSFPFAPLPSLFSLSVLFAISHPPYWRSAILSWPVPWMSMFGSGLHLAVLWIQTFYFKILSPLSHKCEKKVLESSIGTIPLHFFVFASFFPLKLQLGFSRKYSSEKIFCCNLA